MSDFFNSQAQRVVGAPSGQLQQMQQQLFQGGMNQNEINMQGPAAFNTNTGQMVSRPEYSRLNQGDILAREGRNPLDPAQMQQLQASGDLPSLYNTLRGNPALQQAYYQSQGMVQDPNSGGWTSPQMQQLQQYGAQQAQARQQAWAGNQPFANQGNAMPEYQQLLQAASGSFGGANPMDWWRQQGPPGARQIPGPVTQYAPGFTPFQGQPGVEYAPNSGRGPSIHPPGFGFPQNPQTPQMPQVPQFGGGMGRGGAGQGFPTQTFMAQNPPEFNPSIGGADIQPFGGQMMNQGQSLFAPFQKKGAFF